MAYTVPDLPYAYDALEPTIDKATMEFHHDKHHQAYVDRVNGALEGTQWADKPIEDVIKNLGDLPDDKRTVVRNHGGGHLNHTLFWESMAEARSPLGAPPAPGAMFSQNIVWLRWPPPLLRTGPRLSSGMSERFFTTSSIGLSAQSVPSSAPLTRST